MNTSSHTKTLAIDYGTKRIGTAVSFGSLAEPLKIVPNFSQPSETDIVTLEALQELQEIIQNEKIQHVVVGISENTMAQKIQDFVKILKAFLNDTSQKAVSQTIELFDETLSSHEVKQRLSQKGVKHNQSRDGIDHYAAAILLDEWLENNR